MTVVQNTNTQCWQNAEMLVLKVVVRMFTANDTGQEKMRDNLKLDLSFNVCFQ
jgi:hypothetical protein